MKKIALCFFIILGSHSVLADDGSYGCGLGRMVAPKDSLISTTTATAVDFFVPVRISATTTGTRGCTKHDIVKAEQEVIQYAHINYDLLELNAAQGTGEHLVAFGHQLGCDASQQANFAKMMRKNFSKVFNDKANGLELYRKVKSQLNTESLCSNGRA